MAKKKETKTTSQFNQPFSRSASKLLLTWFKRQKLCIFLKKIQRKERKNLNKINLKFTISFKAIYELVHYFILFLRCLNIQWTIFFIIVDILSARCHQKSRRKKIWINKNKQLFHKIIYKFLDFKERKESWWVFWWFFISAILNFCRDGKHFFQKIPNFTISLTCRLCERGNITVTRITYLKQI